jgi:hypothetical protein
MMRTSVLAAGMLLLCSSTALGQDATTSVWRLGAGYESAWIRDVARSGPPADASPVTREGHGPSLDVQRDWTSLRRLHRVHVTAGWAGSIVYSTPTQTIGRPPGEKGFLLEGGYEYRRYPFRDLGLDGFDLGVGIDGTALVRRVTFIFDPAIEARHRGTDLTASVVAAGRLRRWRAWQLEVAWANGITLGRTTDRHSAAAVSEMSEWGGGWLTGFLARADIRVSPTVNVFVTAVTSGRGRYESHATTMTGRTQFIAGVAYAR